MKNFNERLKILLASLEGRDRIEGWQTEELFLLHNHHYPNMKETGKSCTPCRIRVLNKMKKVWNQLNPE